MAGLGIVDRSVEQGLGEAIDRSERRLEVVGDIGEELAQGAVLPVYLIGHVVEGLSELAGFAGAFDGDFVIEAAAGDAAGGGGGGEQGPIDGPGEQQPDDASDDDGEAGGQQEAWSEIAEDGLTFVFGQEKDEEFSAEFGCGFVVEAGGDVVEGGAVAFEGALDAVLEADADGEEIDIELLVNEATRAARLADHLPIGIDEEGGDVGAGSVGDEERETLAASRPEADSTYWA